MADDTFGNNQGGASVSYNPSTHKFTDPIRYFKANDPYYWEVDNIPLKQVQENILWLKDQVSQTTGGEVVGEIGRKEFTELRPFGGNGMQVSVNPGNFIGRVNDAYKTGISEILTGTSMNYEVSSFEKQREIKLNDTVLFNLIGDTTTGVLNNNGLYDHLQTHAANYQGDDIAYKPGYTFDVKNLAIGIYDIPKLKLALWQQDTTTKTWADPTDLQQLAVEFTRAWGAPFRTALVNVEQQLDIIIPSFDENDYPNETAYVPSVRVDLLFIYTKPIDAPATTIARAKDTDSPISISEPTLGIVKGAGVVKLFAQSVIEGSPWQGERVDSTFLKNYDKEKYTIGNYLQRDINEVTDSVGNPQITSPIGDHNKNIGTDGVFTTFPSPDDLMNLAPYLADELNGTPSLSLVGQSVLPIAYIFVENGATTISNDNILDIRPFFRTAELTYNERAGLAAANPPASIANPYVTDRDLQRRIWKLEQATPKYIKKTIELEHTEIRASWWQILNQVQTKDIKAETVYNIEDGIPANRIPYLAGVIVSVFSDNQNNNQNVGFLRAKTPGSGGTNWLTIGRHYGNQWKGTDPEEQSIAKIGITQHILIPRYFVDETSGAEMLTLSFIGAGGAPSSGVHGGSGEHVKFSVYVSGWIWKESIEVMTP